MIKMVLTGLACAVLMSAQAPAQTVREAADTLAARFGSVRAEIDGEPVEDVLREALAEFGALEDPPDRADLIRRVSGDIRAQIDSAHGDGDDDLALFTLETFLPYLLPHLDMSEQHEWMDRYLALAGAQFERDRDAGHGSGAPTFYAELVAAGLHNEARTVADAHIRQLDQLAAELSGAGRLAFLAESRRQASQMARDEAESRYRAEAGDLLLANPDAYLGTPILDWHTAWGPAERDLVRALVQGLTEDRLKDAIFLPFRDERHILALRLDVAEGAVLPGDAIEQVWQRAYAERRRATEDAADLLDAIVRDLYGAGDADAAIALLVTYQNLMLTQSGVRLVELWGELGDCARAHAATRLAVHADTRPDRAALMLARGEDDAAWDEWSNIDAHALVNTNLMRHQEGGWRPRMGAVLLACDRPGFARTALDIQSSGEGDAWQQFFHLETNWLALWATVRTEGDRRALEAAIWRYRPRVDGWYDEDFAPLLPLLDIDRGSALSDRLQVMILMLRGMPETDQATWAPIYRAVIWHKADELPPEVRLAIFLLLAGTAPD
ncbi:hypothetical protein [uncultured Maricaulis sp.]|uniref:hypothetical protein n=1 Tax=uncultured Maricaulis sp. TaxID=174710 RepID=UPI0025DCB6D1|nr:hypothetical protein [uncultured Maricaulis sp.]